MVMLLHDEGKNGIEPEPLVLRQQGSAGGGAAPVGTRTPLGQPSSLTMTIANCDNHLRVARGVRAKANGSVHKTPG